jgi:transposase InsO family protein
MVQRQGDIGIEQLCGLAGVARSGYYRQWQASAPGEEESELRDAVQRIALSQRHYGHRRIAAELKRSEWPVNKKRVLRILREDNLLCVPKRAFIPPTTNSRHGWRVYPNLARHLIPMAINQHWVADITYVRLAEQFVYLAVVLDAYSRRVIGWNLADHLQASLALHALDMAIATREVVPPE